MIATNNSSALNMSSQQLNQPRKRLSTLMQENNDKEVNINRRRDDAHISDCLSYAKYYGGFLTKALAG